MNPAEHEFPTRQYSYQTARVGPAGVAAGMATDFRLSPGGIYRFILGRDGEPIPLAADEVRVSLRDPFADLLLAGAALPLTLRSLLTALKAGPPAGHLTDQRSFVVADGGQIPWTSETADLRREFRLLIVCGEPLKEAVLFVSTSTSFDSESQFLQVIAWDEMNGAYQFYDRRQGAWIWAGSSWEALAPDSRGHGPFDSHVNGALNMKELKAPWPHWHSQAALIRDSALSPDDPVRTERLWQERQQAEELERSVVRPGIRRWTRSRFDHRQKAGQLTHLPEFFRQVLETTTVNLVSSTLERARVTAGDPVPLPLTLFVNSDALLNELELDPGIEAPSVDGAIYGRCLEEYQVALVEGNHQFPGDTHFVFLVPEPAFEDLVVLSGLRERGVLSHRLATCLLMTDFSNPLFSRRRAALMRYLPDTTSLGDEAAFERTFVAAVEAGTAAAGPASGEEEFLANWSLTAAEYRRAFESRLARFFQDLRGRLLTFEGFSPVFELADSRRREFRRRKLAEFRLTTPYTRIRETAPFLELTRAGTVQPKPESES